MAQITVSFAHIDPYGRDYSEISKYFKEGYKPCSTWYEKMVKKLKYDKRKISISRSNGIRSVDA